MKKLKLFLAACAAMVTLGVQAQSWTGNAVEAGTFYLYNVGAGKFLNVGDPTQSWGTNAYLTANFGLDVTLASAGENIYTIDTGIKNKDTEHFLNVSTWTDGAATNWTFRAVDGETNVYQIIYDGQYLMATTGLDDVEMVGDPAGRTTSTYWKLVSLNDFKTAMSSCTLSSPMDVSVFIQGRDFNRNDTRNSKWTHTNTGGNATWMGVKDNKYWGHEYWNNTFNVYQDITGLPDGVYEVSCSGFGTNGTTAIYGNKRENYISTDNTTDRGTDKEAKWVAIQDDNAFASGNTTGKFIVKGGNLRVGLQRRVNKGGDWCIFDSFRLTYYGPIPDEANDVFVGIADPNPLTKTDAWTYSADPNEADVNNNCSGFWSRTATMTQELPNLPAGYYQLTAVAFQRDGGDGTISLNDQSVTLVGCGTVNDRAGANTFFNGGNGVNNLTYHLTADGAITVGLQTNSKGDHWTIYRSFELKYLGEYPMSVTQQVLADAVAEAQGLYASLPTAAQAALQAVVDAKNITYSTGREYSDAADDVIAAIAVARPFIEPYARFLAVKPNVVALKDQTTKFTDPGTAVTTLDAAVAAQQTAVDEATTAEAIETAIVNLRKAASAFAGNVDIVAGQYLDMTDAMLYNASMRETGGLSLWTIASNTNLDYPKYNGRCSEFWGANFEFYQIAPELPEGNYNIEVSAFHRAGTYNTYLYANDEKVQVLPITNGENSMTDAANSFDAGLYVNSIKITLDAATDVKIGFKNEDGNQTDKWTIFRDFKIKYFGDDALALYRDEYESALAAATEALENATYSNVAGTDRSNLNTAVNTTYPKSVVEVDETQEKFETATSNLTALTTTFKNGVASWNNYANTRAGVATAKAEADLFDESIFTGLGITEATNAAEAAAKAAGDEPAIRVATANFVAENYGFSLTSKIGDFSTWTGTALDAEHGDTPVDPQTLDSEHWSNTTRTYYEQSARGWYSDNWSVTYTKVANNLPAGNYVLKLAARGSVDTHGTIASSATANTVTLPSAGNNTRGITTAGVASWSNSDTFRKSAGANTEDNKGAGWQWRFLPFTVSEAGDVTLTINVSSELKWNWVSLADAELLSDEDKTTKITLSDANDMASTIESYDGELATVTMTRKIKASYNSVVLPFDLTAVQVQALFGTGAAVYAFSEDSTDPNDATVNFNKVNTGTINANVPVLVKATEESEEKTIEGVTIVAPTADVKVEGTNFDFVGTYTPIPVIPEGDYFIGNGALYKSAGATSMKAFRAYIKAKTAGGSVKMFIDGENVDAIDAINGEAAEQGVIYNIAGQRVNKAQKGIYIVNGKKVIVK